MSSHRWPRLANRKTLRTRQLFVEQLDSRQLLAVDWRNPVDALDVNGDTLVVPLDALVIINDLNAHGSRQLPVPRVDSTLPFLDVSGNNFVEPLDVLRVINGLNDGIRGRYELREGLVPAAERSVLIGLGQDAGTRTYQFELTAEFDVTDQASALRDRLLVYLVDPQNHSQTLMDRNESGTPLFALSEDGAEFTPGQIRYDGSVVDIDLTSLNDKKEAHLLFQLLNGDTDSGTTVTVRPLTNVVEKNGSARPHFPAAEALAEIGPATDVSSFTDSDQVTVNFEKVRYDSGAGNLVAEMRIHNSGSDIGRNAVVTFPGLPIGVELINASGTDSQGVPYVNFRLALPSGGLASQSLSLPVRLTLKNRANGPISLFPRVKVGGPNQPPVLEPLGPLIVTPGGRLEVTLSATDPDGDALAFLVNSDSRLPTGTLHRDRKLILSPALTDVGAYEFTVTANDGSASVQQSVHLQVTADSNTNTRVSGVVRDANGAPLSGVSVELDALHDKTDASGSFTIDLETSGALPDRPLVIRGETLSGAGFPLLRADVSQLLGHEPGENINNVLPLPITLTPVDTVNATNIIPTQSTIATTAAIPGAELPIGVGVLHNGQGEPFAGELTITEVAATAATSLASHVAPELVVSISPGDVSFSTPGLLQLPNRAGWGANLPMDLFAVNPVSGAVERLGEGRVSSDRSVVQTTAGGVRSGGIAFFVPRGETPRDLDTNSFNPNVGAGTRSATRHFNSDVELHSGAVLETHALVTYSSLGQTRGEELVYDSLRADPRPIVHFGYPAVDPAALAGDSAESLRMRARLSFTDAAGITVEQPDQFFGVPDGTGRLDAALQADLTAEPSGIYAYQVELGLFLHDTGGDLAGTSHTQHGDFVHVNTIGSPFGNGWGLAGWQQLVEQSDGTVLLVDGNGTELLFSPPESSGGPHISPPGDFSTLQQQPDGTFQRTLRDRTVLTFNASNQLTSIADRNGNRTTYIYDSEGRLSSIVDPVNLATTFSYANGHVTAITDPAHRTTSLEYDPDGNLTRIVDPDETAREFQYDSRRQLVGEINKQSDRELTRYGFHGRAIEAVRADGTVVQFDPVETQGLFPPSLTADAAAPPLARRLTDAVASGTDGSGGVTATAVDSHGLIVTQEDGDGCFRFKRIEFNSHFLPTVIEDCNGNVYRISYDAKGNVITHQDTLSIVRRDLEFSVAPANPTDFAIGDFNNDDIPDVAVAIEGFSDFTVLLGVGDGTFQRGEDVRDGTRVSALVAGDFDDDGNLDLAGFQTNGSEVIHIWLGKGDGTFGSPRPFVAGTGKPVADVALADFNNDQQLDILALTTSSNAAGDAALLLGQGNGSFDAPIRIVNDVRSPRGAAVGDVNLDGNLDFVIASQFGFDMALYLGAGNGSFSRSTIPSTAEFINSLQIHEFDGRPGEDLVIGYGEGFTLFPSNGDGTLAPGRAIFADKVMIGLAVGDIDGDTNLDLAAYDNTNYVIAVALGAGDGTFVRIADTPLQLTIGIDVELVDLDADRDLDFVAGATVPDVIAVRLNDGTGVGGDGRPSQDDLEYDPLFNQLTRTLDALGRRRLNEIDPANGNTTSQVVVFGQPDATSGETDDLVTRFTYTPQGLVETETNAVGHVTLNEYDALGRLIRVTMPGEADQTIRKFEYDAAGNQTAVIDENGNRTETDYDEMNRPTSIRDAAHHSTILKYDSTGRVTQSTDAGGNVTEFQYDQAGRVVRRIDPDPDGPSEAAESPVTQYFYDPAGNLSLEIDPSGNATHFRHDSRGRQIEMIDAEGGRTQFEFDSHPPFPGADLSLSLESNPTAVIDPDGNRTEFQYDQRGRLIRETDPLGNAIRYEYDAADNLIHKIDRNGRSTYFEYDPLDRLIEERWLQPDLSVANSIDYNLDPVGNLLAVNDAFSTLHFDYDMRDRVVRVDNLGSPGAPYFELIYTRDAVGNVLTVTESIEGQPGGVLNYSYDGLNRAESVTQSGPGVGPKRVEFSYDPHGHFDTIRRFADLAGTQLVAESKYAYDNLNRIVRLNHTSGLGTPLASYQMGWDIGSRITQIVDVDGTHDFTSDKTNQLTSASNSSASLPGVSYVYDANGNRTGTGIVTGPANRLNSDGQFRYDYDPEGNLIRRREPATGVVRAFEFDHRNRLTRVLDSDSGGIELERIDYSYDALNHRISNRVVSTGSDVATYYAYDIRDTRERTANTDHVLLDFVDDDGPLGPNVLVPTVRYLHGPAVDQVLAQETISNNQVYWLLPDHLRSTRDIATYDETTRETQVVNHIIYDSFGKLVSQSNPSVTTRYLFTGREFDAESGLYYYRGRYYDATTGRFLSEDPLRLVAGDQNLYRYVKNQPLRFVDPTGRIDDEATRDRKFKENHKDFALYFATNPVLAIFSAFGFGDTECDLLEDAVKDAQIDASAQGVDPAETAEAERRLDKLQKDLDNCVDCGAGSELAIVAVVLLAAWRWRRKPTTAPPTPESLILSDDDGQSTGSIA